MGSGLYTVFDPVSPNPCFRGYFRGPGPRRPVQTGTLTSMALQQAESRPKGFTGRRESGGPYRLRDQNGVFDTGWMTPDDIRRHGFGPLFAGLTSEDLGSASPTIPQLHPISPRGHSHGECGIRNYVGEYIRRIRHPDPTHDRSRTHRSGV